MKKYIHSTQNSITVPINVVVEIEFEYTSEIAAATYEKDNMKFNVPDGPLPPSKKEIYIDPNSQIAADYEAFIESVTDLVENYYELHIYYKNKSSDFSKYFGILAKNDDESLIIDFDFTLRISNHTSHRTKNSQQHKKEQKQELKKVTNGKRTKPIVAHILVNKDECNSYLEAYQKVDKRIEGAVKVMKRKDEKK